MLRSALSLLIHHWVITPCHSVNPLDEDDTDTDDPPESLTYELDFGDGSPTVTGNPDAKGQIQVTHTYNSDMAFPNFFETA